MEATDAGQEKDRYQLYARPGSCVSWPSFDRQMPMDNAQHNVRMLGKAKRQTSVKTFAKKCTAGFA